MYVEENFKQDEDVYSLHYHHYHTCKRLDDGGHYKINLKLIIKTIICKWSGSSLECNRYSISYLCKRSKEKKGKLRCKMKQFFSRFSEVRKKIKNENLCIPKRFHFISEMVSKGSLVVVAF